MTLRFSVQEVNSKQWRVRGLKGLEGVKALQNILQLATIMSRMLGRNYILNR